MIIYISYYTITLKVANLVDVMTVVELIIQDAGKLLQMVVGLMSRQVDKLPSW